MQARLSIHDSLLRISFAIILLTQIDTVSSMKATLIPPSGSPPMNILYSCSVFDPQTSSIFIIGGQNQYTGQDTADVYSYNLQTNTWAQIVRTSEFAPNGIEMHYCYLSKQRVVYVFFGSSNQLCFNEVFTFDLSSYGWNTVKLTGNAIEGRTSFLTSSFLWNNEETIAIYGGYTNSGFDDNIYL
jgi:hypothetical protein